MRRHLMLLSLLAGCFGGEASIEPAEILAESEHADGEHGEGHAEGEHADGEHADEHAEGEHTDVVMLTPEAVESARIRVAPATEGTFTSTLQRSGRIALDPTKEALVSAWIPGQVDTIAVRPGDRVERGQVLATVQSAAIGEAVGAFRSGTARHEAAEARLARLRQLEADGVSSRAQVLEAEAVHTEAEGALEAAEERLRVMGVDLWAGDPGAGEHYASHVPVRSPIAGEVLGADVRIGQPVEPGKRLFHVGDLDEVWLLVDVYEQDLSQVHEGQVVRFETAAWPGEIFSGEVEQVGSYIDPVGRTAELRVVVDNPDHRLKPNMFATAILESAVGNGPRGLVLPNDAVQEMDGRSVVFVQEEPGRFVPRAVTVGERSAELALVTSGIQAGEPTVVEGAFALKSELEKSELGEGHAH